MGELPPLMARDGHGLSFPERAGLRPDGARLARERTLAFLADHVG